MKTDRRSSFKDYFRAKLTSSSPDESRFPCFIHDNCEVAARHPRWFEHIKESPFVAFAVERNFWRLVIFQLDSFGTREISHDDACGGFITRCRKNWLEAGRAGRRNMVFCFKIQP